MSTRSGKRIHKSLHENLIEKENNTDLNGEIKTRSRRLKDNLDNLNITLPKSRKNYVQYPSTEEEPIPEVLEPKTNRTLRNQTLKEINNEECLLTNGDKFIIHPKPTRATRKTKKFAEENVIVENNQKLEEIQPKKSKKAKKQKLEPNGETVDEKENVNKGLDPNEDKPTKTKKKNKKEKRSTEKTKNNTLSLNNTASSLDSFHSASDTPLKIDVVNNEIQNDSLKTNNNIEKHSDVEETSSKGQKKSKKNKKDGKNKLKKKNAEVTIDVADAIMIGQAENISTEIKLNGTFDIETNKIQSEPENVKTVSAKKDTSPTKPLNSTFDKENDKTTGKKDSLTPKPLDSTFDKQNDIINTTFDKEKEIINTTFDKNSNNSDGTINLTFDKSNESFPKINISSDTSKTENILNTTPLLIESSMDCTKTPEDTEKEQRATRSKTPITPLQREETFTKDGPDPIIIMSPRPKVFQNLTPSKRHLSLTSPGRTPYHSGTKIDKKEKNVLNKTHSIEKTKRRSSLEPARSTKVMFCSPMNNTVLASQRKSRVIKSSMKGSNKSFVFDDNGVKSRLSRKRSLTTNDCDEPRSSSKRTKLADDLQESVDRLSRPRSSSATTNNKTSSTTPVKKPVTPAKAKSEAKSEAKSRSKLPNFAALHRKQFAKMESLDECQERKAKRAQRLLVPTGGIAVLERSSPKVPQEPKSVTKEQENKKSQTVTKMQTATKNYTRFGFKLNLDVNPFSIPSTTTKEPREKVEKATKKDEKRAVPKHTNFLKRSVSQYHIKKVTKNPLPSTAGVTALRKDEAKQVILREKSNIGLKEKSVSKRLENRTIIKGVRTNRRFELQMQSRNIE